MRNIIISGMDAVGKTYLCDKLVKKYGLDVIKSTATTSNTYEYHINLLDYHTDTLFDRFHTGEVIFPYIYNREPKLDYKEFDKITKRIMDNNDLYIIMYSFDFDLIKKRLEERGEKTSWEIEPQANKYKEVAEYVEKKFKYKNFYKCDIAEPGAYDKLDAWIDEHFGKTTINIVYRQLAKDLIEKGEYIDSVNPRGGTKEICNYKFTIDDISEEYVSLLSGGTNLSYAAAELLWYMSGRNDLKFISNFASLWEKVSDDGKTSNSAYGYILQHKHGFNQIEKIIELLKKDPNSRRAIININVPNKNRIETKDDPCTICLSYRIRDGKLDSTAIMRASDCRYGLLNDLIFFISLQKYIANRLNLKYGSYTHFSISMHMYMLDMKFVKDIAYSTLEKSTQKLDINKLLENKDSIINYIDNKLTTKSEFKEYLTMNNILYDEKFVES